tara:strand:+ start:27 stop:2078 length:2052 start_codon:yes stop_codon:yes gene_type:complete
MDNIRVKQESLHDWRSQLEIDEGLVTTGLALSAAGGLAAWALPKLKKNVDKKLEDASKNMSIGGQYRKKQIEKNSGVKLEQISNWRDDFHPTEIESIDIIKAEPLVERDVYVKSDRNPNTGIPIGLKSGGIKDAGTDPVDVMKKMILGDKAEVKKKKETVAASYEADLENIMLEFVEEDINLLYENGFTYEEIAEFYITEEYLTEAPGLIPGAVKGATFIAKQVIPKVTRFAFKTALPRAKKDIGIVSKFVRNPETWKKAQQIAGRANRDFDKVALPAAKGVRSVGNFLKQLPARTYDTTQKVIKGTQKTVNALKSATNTVKSTGSDLVKKTGPTVKKGAKKFTDFVLNTYDKVEKNVGQAIVNRGKQDVAIRRFDKAKVNVWKDKLGAKALERPGDKAGDVISVGKKTGDAAKYRKPGDPWHQFMKKRKPLTGVPKAPVDRTNKLLTPGKTTVIDKLRSTRNKLADVGGKLATTAKDKGSKLVSQVRKFFGKKKTNQLTGASINQRSLPSKTSVKPVKPSTTTTSSGHTSPKPSWDYVRPTKIKNSITPPSGSPAPKPEFRGGLSPKSSKATSAKRWMELNKAAKATMGSDKAATTAAVTGGATAAVGLLSKKSDENKTISNTEKKTVDPKKNNVVKNNVVKNKEEKKKLTPTQKWDKKRVAKLKYGKSGSHLSPLEQEMAN